MYIRKWVWQMFYFCTYNNTSTVKRFVPHQRHLDKSTFIWICNFIHTMFVHSLECMSIILCHLQKKNLIPSTCKLYSDLIWEIYFLIPTLLSVKLKKYIYLFEGLLFYNEKYLFWESIVNVSPLPVVAADCEVTCRSVKAGWIVHYELEDKYINVWN